VKKIKYGCASYVNKVCEELCKKTYSFVVISFNCVCIKDIRRALNKMNVSKKVKSVISVIGVIASLLTIYVFIGDEFKFPEEKINVYDGVISEEIKTGRYQIFLPFTKEEWEVNGFKTSYEEYLDIINILDGYEMLSDDFLKVSSNGLAAIKSKVNILNRILFNLKVILKYDDWAYPYVSLIYYSLGDKRKALKYIEKYSVEKHSNKIVMLKILSGELYSIENMDDVYNSTCVDGEVLKKINIIRNKNIQDIYDCDYEFINSIVGYSSKIKSLILSILYKYESKKIPVELAYTMINKIDEYRFYFKDYVIEDDSYVDYFLSFKMPRDNVFSNNFRLYENEKFNDIKKNLIKNSYLNGLEVLINYVDIFYENEKKVTDKEWVDTSIAFSLILMSANVESLSEEEVNFLIYKHGVSNFKITSENVSRIPKIEVDSFSTIANFKVIQNVPVIESEESNRKKLFDSKLETVKKLVDRKCNLGFSSADCIDELSKFLIREVQNGFDFEFMGDDEKITSLFFEKYRDYYLKNNIKEKINGKEFRSDVRNIIEAISDGVSGDLGCVIYPVSYLYLSDGKQLFFDKCKNYTIYKLIYNLDSPQNIKIKNSEIINLCDKYRELCVFITAFPSFYMTLSQSEINFIFKYIDTTIKIDPLIMKVTSKIALEYIVENKIDLKQEKLEFIDGNINANYFETGEPKNILGKIMFKESNDLVEVTSYSLKDYPYKNNNEVLFNYSNINNVHSLGYELVLLDSNTVKLNLSTMLYLFLRMKKYQNEEFLDFMRINFADDFLNCKLPMGVRSIMLYSDGIKSLKLKRGFFQFIKSKLDLEKSNCDSTFITYLQRHPT